MQHEHGHNIIWVIWFLVASCQAAWRWDTSGVAVRNWISDTVLSLNLPLKCVYIISWLRCNAVWIIHEGLHGIFMGVQFSLVDPSSPAAQMSVWEKNNAHIINFRHPNSEVRWPDWLVPCADTQLHVMLAYTHIICCNHLKSLLLVSQLILHSRKYSFDLFVLQLCL